MITFGAIAINNAIRKVEQLAKDEMVKRGKVATGRTMSTLSTFTVQGSDYLASYLEGEDQWKFVGNGRGPGGMPPIGPIQAWIDAKGLPLSAWGVAKKIAKEGSKDYRNNAPNVFLSAFDTFLDGAGVKELEEGTADEFEETLASQAIKIFKSNGRPN